MSNDDDRRTHRRRVHYALAIAAAFVLALAALYTAWEIRSRSALASTIAGWQQAGEPIEPSDFEPHDIGPDSNAAAFLIKIGEKVDEYTDPSNDKSFTGHLPLSPAGLELLKKHLQRNAGVLDDQRRALAKQDIEWNTKPQLWLEPQTAGLLHLNEQRRLATLRGQSALLHIQLGDESAACDDIAESLAHARAAGHISPTLVCSLVATGIRATAIARADDLAQSPLEGTTRPASPQARQALIAALLDDSAAQAEWRRAMTGERAIELHQGRAFVTRCIPPAAGRQHLVTMLQTTTKLREIGALQSWPAAQAQLATATPPPPAITTAISSMYAMTLPSFTRAIETRMISLAESRMAAVALAIHWYRADHAGEFPSSLADLVPTYLPSLPADPFAADGRTFGYLRADAKPRIYSVGFNGNDDAGSIDLMPKKPSPAASRRWGLLDPPLYLTRQPASAETPEE